jgi:hypothetical protein
MILLSRVEGTASVGRPSKIRAWLKSNTTETAVVEKPVEEDEHAGHHGHPY